MSTVTAHIAVSLDGYAAGPNQSADLPFGEGVDGRLHTWMFDHAEDNRDEIDGIVNAGAYIMGRNMFGPIRGEWDLDWTGWWGEEPPYRAPVFVLTHYPRDPVPMAGGTTFHFVTDGPGSALEQATAAAGDRPVDIAGGASTVNAYLQAGAIDELYLHISPVLLGAGERLFDGVSSSLELEPVHVQTSPAVTHIHYRVG